jgi:hypothetical protein
MAYPADHPHHPNLDAVVKVNQTALLVLLWTFLAACVASSVIYDLTQLVSALHIAT